MNEIEEILDTIRMTDFLCCDDCLAKRTKAVKQISELIKQARLDELKNFEPFFKGDHANCLDPKSCIGYGNAQSDFDNEKQIRIDQLNSNKGAHDD